MVDSPVDQVIVCRLTALEPSAAASAPGRITATIAMSTPMSASVRAEGDDTLVLAGVNGDAFDIKGALTYQARVRVLVDGGSLLADGTQLRIVAARSATLLIAAATSFRRYDDVSGVHPAAATRQVIAAAAGRSFDAIRNGHVTDILALQLDFISRDLLVAAMNAWVLAKDRSLGGILLERGAFSQDRRPPTKHSFRNTSSGTTTIHRRVSLPSVQSNRSARSCAISPTPTCTRVWRWFRRPVTNENLTRPTRLAAAYREQPRPARPLRAACGSAYCGRMPRAGWARSLLPAMKNCTARSCL